MKRFFGILTVAFAMVASANIAADSYGCNSCDRDNGNPECGADCKRCCKPKMDCCCDPETGKMVKKPARCGNGAVELLYMKGCRGLHFANTGAVTAESRHYSEDDWELGFRISRTFPIPCKMWDIKVEYTQLDADGDGSATDSGATIGVLSGDTGLNSVTFTSEVEHRVLDIVAQYACCACQPLELIPYGGFRAMWMDQEFVETNTGGTAGDGARYTSDYTGYGLTGGLGWVFHSSCPWDVFGRFGGSVVCGENKASKTVTGSGATTEAWSNNEPERSSFGWEASIGVRKESCYCGCPWLLSVSWEMSHWSNIDNPMIYSTHGACDSCDIGFHGLAFRAQTTF